MSITTLKSRKKCYHEILSTSIFNVFFLRKRKNLQLHTSRVHDAVKDKKCPRCPTLFRREETLKDHVRSMHSSLSIICKHCTSVSRDKYEHMEHKKSHATKYCSLCDYKCFKSDTLKRHVRNNHETKEPDVQLSQDETEGVAIKTESLMTHLNHIFSLA